MSELSRRELLGTAIAAGAMILSSHEAVAATLPTLSAFQPKPLPFDAAKLSGISEKLILSHHKNNYSGAVKRLNAIQEKIRQLPADAAPFQMGSLKREELVAANSMILHEYYFGNLGGNGNAGRSFTNVLNKQFGSLEEWERQFRLTGQALGGGSGWVILAYSPRDKNLFNVWSSDHTQTLAAGVPLLVMDMYEHAYQMDYGADAKAYIDAFFKNINWDEVEKRAAELHLA
jgi:Fe-Mn family superoxide dismutase